MKHLINILMALLCWMTFSVQAWDLKAIIADMDEGQRFKYGKNEELGVYYLAKGIVDKDSKLSMAELTEIGIAVAKNEIASALCVRVRSEDSVNSRMTITSGGKEGKADYNVVENIEETITIDVDQLLHGMTVVSVVDKGQEMWVYCLASTSIAKIVAEMEKKSVEMTKDQVMAVGIAMNIDEDQAAQRRFAIEAAKRSAVEQVLGTGIATTTQIQDWGTVKAKIYASASGFVEEYRIIEEGKFSGGYKVKILAKVSRDKLLSNYTAIMKSMGDPSFAVMTNQKDLYHLLCVFFTDLGVHIVEDENVADYIIDAQGDFRAVRNPATQMNGVQLSLSIRILDARTGRQLLSVRNDPRKAAVFHSQGERKVELAAEMACRQLKKPLHEKINEMIGRMSAMGREIQIVVDNYNDEFSKELQCIVKGLEMVPGCKNVNMNVDGIGQKAVIHANYTATIDALAHFLVERLTKEIEQKSRRPKVVSYTNTELSLSFINKEN